MPEAARGASTPRARSSGGGVDDVVAQHVRDALAREGRPPCEALEEHRAERVEVRRRVHLAVDEARLLRRHVARRPDRKIALRSRHAGAREPDVDERRANVARSVVDEDVGGLYVAMEDAGLVELLEALGDQRARASAS